MELKKVYLLILFTGIFSAFSVLNAYFLLSWVCYIPLFYILNSNSKLSFFKSGFCFGIGVSTVSFFWIFKGANEFSGNSWIYGTFLILISSSLFSLYWAVLIKSLGILSLKCKNNPYLMALCAASVFVLFESVLNYVFNKAPYYMYNSGYGLLNNIYTIQWASYFGLPILSFIVVFVNYLISKIIISGKWLNLILPSGIILLIIGMGFLIKLKAENDVIFQGPIKVAIVAENVPPLLKWDNGGGNVLAQRLLSLNEQAALLKPDIVLWSESVIPWTYKSDDDLLLEILKEPYPEKTTHIIGLISDHSSKTVYNSVYGIATNGKIIGRYDKQQLLDFVEAPILGLSLPFLNLNNYLIEPGNKSNPIITPYGNAGISICNEIVNPKSSVSMVKNNAEFLLTLSNDGWFKNNYIVGLHFLFCRLNAVISRKDLVTNSNNGFSGYIKYTGEIMLKRKSNDFFVEMVAISSNRFNNYKYYFPNLILGIAIILIFTVLLKEFSLKKA
ncbi:apolipoprotein N-acyltransferase [Pedobacter arcticus]|uniref:apolipoprotein N-acyltransferase n=1 Tax=Pedobacter arcticus TaxID=752140 RepID=UPI0002F02E1B|nr:apolipoprotein N-acyltransferase [Pedobacter arcticus]